MQDKEGPKGVDLGKRPDLDTPRSDDLEGVRGAEIKKTSSKRPLTIFGALGILLLALAAVAYVLFGHEKTASPPPPPPIIDTPRPAPPPVEEPQVEEPQEEAPVDYKLSARDKICTSLAKEFLDAPTPNAERQRRTLMIYNVNRCSNWFILKADAEGRGLDENEMKALDEYTDEDIGPLRAEDK